MTIYGFRYRRKNLFLPFLFFLFLLFASCEAGDGEMNTVTIREADEATVVPRESFAYEMAEEDPVRLLREDRSLVLYAKGKRSLLDETFHPAKWEEYDGAIPKSRYGEYTLTDGTLFRDGKELPVSIGETETVLGFWAWNRSTCLVSVRPDPENGGENAAFLRPLPAGDPFRLRGIRIDGRALGSDGTWNYYTSGTILCRTDGERMESIGDITHFGADPNSISGMEPVENGLLLLSGDTLIGLAFAEQQNNNTEEDPDQLVVGAYYPSPYVIRAVSQYNLAADDAVELRSFEDKEKMNFALLSGEIDVIASYDAGLLENYARRGVLTPLESVVEDEVREKIAENIRAAGTIDGKLFMIPDLVKISGMILPEAVVRREGNGITSVSELAAVLKELEIRNFYQRTSRENALNQLLMHGVSAWVDLERRECRFEDPDFIELLRLAEGFARDDDQTAANQDEMRKPLFSPWYSIRSPEGFAALSLWYEVKGSGVPYSDYGLRAVLLPCPAVKDSGLTLEPDMLFAVTKNGAKKPESGRFLSWILSEKTQQDAMGEGIWGLPVRPDLWEMAAERAIQDTLGTSSLSEEEARGLYDGFVPLCLSADHYGGSSFQEITDVIREEALRYFSGEITAEKAAEYIQNRASIYLAEQG